jgi:hypothetical protein
VGGEGHRLPLALLEAARAAAGAEVPLEAAALRRRTLPAGWQRPRVLRPRCCGPWVLAAPLAPPPFPLLPLPATALPRRQAGKQHRPPRAADPWRAGGGATDPTLTWRLSLPLPPPQMGGKLEGTPLAACPACSGKGRTLCGACGASGLRNAWLWRPAGDPGWGPRGEP